MKRIFLSLLVLALPAFVGADEASHKAAATKLVSKLSSKESMMTGFNTMIDGMAKRLASQGIPEAGVKEVKEAMTGWVQKEFNFEALAPQIADLYAQEFSEEELNQLSAFYDTPAGQKLIAKLPVLTGKTAALQQEQMGAKSMELQKLVMGILAKYSPGLPGAPASPAPPASGAK